jgi:hypothetical protein
MRAIGGGLYSSPTVIDGLVFAGSPDDNAYTLNASTGHFVWSYTTGSFVESSPAVAGGVVYVGSVDDNVYAFSVSGSGGGLPAIEMYAIIAIVAIVIVAIVAAVYLVVRRRRPGESAGQGMHM